MGRFKSLPSRVAIALPGIGLFVLVAILDSSIITAGFFSIVAVITAAEAVRLIAPGSGIVLVSVAALLTGGASFAVALLPAELSMALLVIPGLLISLLSLVRDGIPDARRRTAGMVGLTVLISLGFGLLARLRTGFDSPWVMFVPLLICWGGDSLAYFAGSAFGRHRMAPAVSPSKSWEGFAAGLAGSAGGALIAGTAGAGFRPAAMIILGLLAGLAAVAGDLFESALKRDAGVKDTGGFLLGHGGLLDRFDSLLAVVPVVWCCLHVMGRMGIL